MRKASFYFVFLFVFVIALSNSCFAIGMSLYGRSNSGSGLSLKFDSSIAPTPPMGWNSWNAFRTKINAKKIKEMADAMVQSGMKDAGYQYIIIDDGWMTKKRDKDGHIIVDSTKFPNGIKPVADYVHSLGLKFGIYSSPGYKTCQRLMGSKGYEQTDANDYASWGVDFLKYDHCHFPREKGESKKHFQDRCRVSFEMMGSYLKKTGRDIVYSVHDKCAATLNDDLPWVKGVANMHRTSNDIQDNWKRMLYCLNTTAYLWQYAGNGYWNDPDMLEVGNRTQEKSRKGFSDEKMNLEEYKTHFSMWCMVAAPLIAGNDLRKMEPKIVDILTNKEMIAVDQDPLGRQGKRMEKTDSIEIWVKDLTKGKMAVALLNKGEKERQIKVDWDKLHIKGDREIRDLWEHKNLGTFNHSFSSDKISRHGVQVLELKIAN